MRAFTLHYAHEVRSEADYFADIPPLELPEEVVDVTQLILNTKREHFDPTYLGNDVRNRALLQSMLDLPLHLQLDVAARYLGGLPKTIATAAVPSFLGTCAG